MKYNYDELKECMRRIWKMTFGDSDTYLDLIFNKAFDWRYSGGIISDGEITSILLGIPYFFDSKDSVMPPLKGLYLCGLVTLPDFRKRGQMGRLMHHIEEKATEDGFDFTFLIPADGELRRYYQCHGYRNMSSIEKLNIKSFSNSCFIEKIYSVKSTANSEFILRDFVRIDSKRYVKNEYHDFDSELLICLSETACQLEKKRSSEYMAKISSEDEKGGKFYILHTQEQWLEVVIEKLVSGGEIWFYGQSERFIEDIWMIDEKGEWSVIGPMTTKSVERVINSEQIRRHLIAEDDKFRQNNNLIKGKGNNFFDSIEIKNSFPDRKSGKELIEIFSRIEPTLDFDFEEREYGMMNKLRERNKEERGDFENRKVKEGYEIIENEDILKKESFFGFINYNLKKNGDVGKAHVFFESIGKSENELKMFCDEEKDIKCKNTDNYFDNLLEGNGIISFMLD